ncbi:PREDICTED: solute carrier family 22 member 9-like [Chrysochloris asiatica]|uniref:Solute carrier family 22 member 9-like n=1 Tax=Chrysochloris asiatica TaxID=185453 RepID=A0A9B0SVM3_CHRAS|nr:PREDICTED: solute carrier family 22 member 9-like [Chrysochloris asiatica]
MAFSELLQCAGDFGKFQIIQSILTGLLNILMITHMLVENFSAATPAHRCYIHLLDSTKSGTNFTKNLTTEELLRVSIPMSPDQKPEQCRRFKQIQWQLLDLNESVANINELDTEPCLDGWIYDQSVFTSTIVTQWDLVCDSQSLKVLSQFLFMTGSMLGTPISGYFADRFGRKPLLLCFSLVCALTGVCSAFAPTFSIYCTLRLIVALSLGTIFNNSLVLLVEWCPTQFQPMITTAITLILSIGQVLLAGLAYVFRDWQTLQLSISLPYFVYFLFIWWFSESARWLIMEGKLENSLRELKRVANFNGSKDAANNLNLEFLRSAMKTELASRTDQIKIKELLASPIMCRTILCLFFIRFSALFFFYGLMLDLKNLGDNLFLNQALLGVIDIPTKYPAFFIMKYINRRTALAPVLFLAGSSVLINIFIPKDWPNWRLAIAMIGKGFMAIYFNMGIIYNNELLPTGMRSTLQGLITLVSRLGATAGTFVLITKYYFAPLPMIFYGAIPILASISVYFLPETRNCPLPDSIADVEKRTVRGTGNLAGLVDTILDGLRENTDNDAL